MIRLDDVLDRQREKVDSLKDTDLIRLKRGDTTVLISVEDFVWCVLGLLKGVNDAKQDSKASKNDGGGSTQSKVRKESRNSGEGSEGI